ncbi:MAG: oligosaccharide flippase family protein [Bacteroidetes bacterium]|nr:oligosaccharide flippase family protein [Bacteroidota bacterium]
MRRKFLTNLILLLTLNLLIKPFWILGVDRSVQNMVGAADYGFYFAIFNFSFLFNILLDFGITNFNNKNIAQNNHLLNKHFSSIVILKLMLAVVFAVVTFSFGMIVGYNQHQLVMLGWMVFNQFLISFVLYLRSNISGLLLFKTDSMISVLDRTLMIIFCSILIWGHVTTEKFRIEWFVYAQTLAYLITAIIAFIIVKRKSAFTRLKWNRPFFVMIIKQSIPFAILALLMTFYNRIDSVMLERLLPGTQGDEQAGIYASSYRLLDATNMIAYLFAVLLLPLFSKMLKNGDEIVHIVKLSFKLLITLAIVIGIGSFFYSFELMNMLYTNHVKESADVFKWLMMGFIAVSTTYVFGTLLTANGNLKELNFIAATGMLLNISLNFILIPRLEAVGSAYSSIVTQFLSAIVQVIIAQRVFKFKIDYRFLISLLAFVVGVIFINIFSKHFIEQKWMYNFAGMVILSVVYASFLKLLNFKSLLSLIQKKAE